MLENSYSEKPNNTDVHHDENLSNEQQDYTTKQVRVTTNVAEHVSYSKTGIRGLVSSPYVFGAALLTSLGGFSFGYDQGVISIINIMPQFHQQFPQTDPNSPGSGFYTGFMTGMLELGAFLGCFFMPKLADTISRKWALTTVAIIFNIGAIIQTASTSYGMLVAGRTIGGIGVGTLAMVSDNLLHELFFIRNKFVANQYDRALLCISLRYLHHSFEGHYWCSNLYLW